MGFLNDALEKARERADERQRECLFARVSLFGDLSGTAFLLDDRIPLGALDDVLEVPVVTGHDQEAARIRADLFVDRLRDGYAFGAAVVAALANEQTLLIRAASLPLGEAVDLLVYLPEQRLVPRRPLLPQAHR